MSAFQRFHGCLFSLFAYFFQLMQKFVILFHFLRDQRLFVLEVYLCAASSLSNSSDACYWCHPNKRINSLSAQDICQKLRIIQNPP